MGEIVEFPGNGANARGYVALPDAGSGSGVIVLQEWWGLNPSIMEMADRLAASGFVAFVPDLYRGDLAGHDEVDKAAGLMAALPADRAARDMSAAVDFLAAHPAVKGDGLGIVGFCMGGMLTWLLAARRPDRIVAAAPFYGYPSGDSEPDWTAMRATVRGHMAEHDDFFPPEGALALEAKLREMGKDVQLTVHRDAGHAFMGPHDTFGTLREDLVAAIWPETCRFLHEQLD